MSWRLWAGLIFLYVVVALLTGVMTEMYYGSSETTIIDYLLRPETPSYTNPVGGITTTVSVSAGFMGALFDAIFLNSPIFDGPYQIIRILILTFAIGGLVYLVISNVKQ